MDMVTLFLGKPADYWIALEQRLNEMPASLEVSNLITEVVRLRGKLSFYESRITEMASQLQK